MTANRNLPPHERALLVAAVKAVNASVEVSRILLVAILGQAEAEGVDLDDHRLLAEYLDALHLAELPRRCLLPAILETLP